MPPKHILNAPTKLMKEIGYGKGYEYDHDTEDGFSGQNYFPEGMRGAVSISPGRARLRARDHQAPGILGSPPRASKRDRKAPRRSARTTIERREHG